MSKLREVGQSDAGWRVARLQEVVPRAAEERDATPLPGSQPPREIRRVGTPSAFVPPTGGGASEPSTSDSGIWSCGWGPPEGGVRGESNGLRHGA